MPPSNISFATATTITLPFTGTQSDINDTGVNYTVYYRFIAPANSIMIGAWGFSGHLGSGYQPTIAAFNGPAGAPTQILGIAAQNIPIQFPVTVGNEYFLRFTKNVDTAGPEHIDVDVLAHADSAIANGNIAVMDDTAGFPMAFMSHVSDNVAIVFVPGMPAGEGGDITIHGVMCMQDNTTNNINIYDNTFALVAFLTTSGSNPRIRTCRAVSKFYVGFDESPPTVKVVTEAGTVGGTIFTLSGASLESLAADNSESVLYYSARGFGVPVKRWDLVLNSALSDLVASVASYQNPDILVLADGNIIVLYYNSTSKDVQAKRYNTSGTVLNTYSLGAQTASTKPRMAYAIDDPNSFWVFTHNVTSNNGVTIGRNVKVSDGSILTTRSWMEYEGGAYNGSQTASPLARFGNSFSCPFFIAIGDMVAPGGGVAPGDMSGLYFINPANSHEIYYDASRKIPDPTIRTALIGE